MSSKTEVIQKIWEFIEEAPLLKIYLKTASTEFPVIPLSKTALQELPEAEQAYQSQKLLCYLDGYLKIDKFNLGRAEETVDTLLNTSELPSFYGQQAIAYQQKLSKIVLTFNSDKTALILPLSTVELFKELLAGEFKRSNQNDIHKLISIHGYLQVERNTIISKFNAFLPEDKKIPQTLCQLTIPFPSNEVFALGKFQELFEIPNTIVSKFKIFQNAFFDLLSSPQRLTSKFSTILYIAVGAGAMSLLKKYLPNFLKTPYAAALPIVIFLILFYSLRKQYAANDASLEKAWGTINEGLKKTIRDVCEDNRRNLKDLYKITIRKVQQDWYRMLRDVYLNPDVLPIYDKYIMQIEKFKKELNQP